MTRADMEDLAVDGLAEPAGKAHYHGHRERLWSRFRKSDGAALEDYELLELLLCASIRRADTKPLAKALITQFGSFADVLGAPRARLREVHGAGEKVVDQLKLAHVITRRYVRGKVNDREVLSSWDRVLDYSRIAMGHNEREEFRVLFLDKKNGLIADEVQQRGTVDHTPVYPREIMKRALELAASALILIHNHPTGDPTPSQADIQMTRRIDGMAREFGIILHDHIIIGRERHASLRGLKLF